MSGDRDAPPVASLPVASARRAIRDAVVARLRETVGTTSQGETVWRTAVGPRVFGARLRVLQRHHLPAILVYAREEQIPPQPQGHANGFEDGWKHRDLSLAVQVVLAVGEALDDQADLLTAQVEAALDGFTIPGRESATLLLEETQIGVNDKGEVPIGGALMTWRVRHHTPWRVLPAAWPPDWIAQVRLGAADGGAEIEPITGQGG